MRDGRGTSARQLARRVRGTATVARTALGQRGIPYRPWREIEDLRDRRVREIAGYAGETVPHYRELWRAEGIDPRSIRTAAELDRLPVLEKDEVRRDPDRLVSESPLGRASVPFLTSGTTGLRLRIHHDRRELLLTPAFRERQRHVEVRLTGKQLRYVKMTVTRPGDTGLKVRRLLDDSTVLVRGRRRTVSSAQPLERIVDAVNGIRPDVLRAGGSLLELLFRTVVATGTRMYVPGVVRYGDDTMTDEGRELIEGQFGARVIASYNAVEAFHLAYTCERRHAYHLYSDLTHVAVLPDGADRPVAEGRGDVLVSSLLNRGTVLLNYRLGDVATLSREPCPCGRTGPVLVDLEGRVEDLIRLADGTLLSPRLVWDVVRKRESVIRYRLVQLERSRFEFGVVTDTREAYDVVAEGLRGELAALLGGARVESRFDPSLLEVDRKFRPVVALPG